MQQQRVRRYRSHLENGPMTVVPCRAKTTPLPRASILFRPHDTGRRAGGLVEAAGTAPGPATLIPCGVCRHSRVLPDSVQYSRVAGPLKGKHRACGGRRVVRSEEHTSELQSLMRISYAGYCLTTTRHTHL